MQQCCNLRNISEQDLEEMEKFIVSETALDLIPKSEYDQFYGVFHTNPTKFKFLLGHKKLLLLFAKFFADKFQKRNAESDAEQSMLRSGYSSSVFDEVFDNKQEARYQKKGLRLHTSNLTPVLQILLLRLRKRPFLIETSK